MFQYDCRCAIIHFLPAFMPSWCWQGVSELLSEFFMLRKSSGLTAELVLHCFLFEQRHLNCSHFFSCSHFLPQIFPLPKCLFLSLLLNLTVQLLRPGLLSHSQLKKSLAMIQPPVLLSQTICFLHPGKMA